MTVRIIVGDVRDKLAELPDESVHCCVTSPPYWGLRAYGDDPNEIGREPTLRAYVDTMVEVFAEVRRVLKPDGVLWLNLGDSYVTKPHAKNHVDPLVRSRSVRNDGPTTMRASWRRDGAAVTPVGGGGTTHRSVEGLKYKDLIGVPWRVALALQDDGWWLRSDIVWHKRSPLPESVRDRPTRSHEYVFLLAKSQTYYYDADAIAEPLLHPEDATAADASRAFSRRRETAPDASQPAVSLDKPPPTTRNARSVWEIASVPNAEAHFAMFPPELPRRCIAAGSRQGDTVLDPFLGAGTTAMVACRLGRDAIGIDLYQANADISANRIRNDAPLLNRVRARPYSDGDGKGKTCVGDPRNDGVATRGEGSEDVSGTG